MSTMTRKAWARRMAPSMRLNTGQPPRAGTGAAGVPVHTGAMKTRSLRDLSVFILAAVLTAAQAAPVPTAGDRRAFEAGWQSQGLQPVAKSRLDLLYVRPGLAAGTTPMEFAP